MAGDVHEVVIAYEGAGSYFENVQHWQNPTSTSTDPEGDSADIANAWYTTMFPLWQACTAAIINFIGIRAKRINNTGGPSAVFPASSLAAGGVVGDIDNTRVAAVITGDYYNSSSSTPHWRVGKQFLGGVPTGFMVDNIWTSTAITAYLAYCAGLHAGLTGASLTWTNVIWSNTYNIAYVPTNWELTPTIGSLAKRVRPHL